MQIKRKELETKIKEVAQTINKKHSIHALQNILFFVKDDTVYISGTNTETSIQISLGESMIFSDGTMFTVDCQKLSKIIKNMKKSEYITLNLDSFNLTLEDEKGLKINVGTTGHEKTYPILELPNEKTIDIELKELQKAIKKTIFAVSEDESRGTLTCINLETEDKKVIFTATDGHRLGNVSKECSFKGEFNYNLQPQILIMLLKLKDDENYSISFDSNSFYIHASERIYAGKLNTRNYPDYRSVLSDTDKRVTYDRKDLIEILDTFQGFVNQKTFLAEININKDNTDIVCNNRSDDIKANQTIDNNIDKDNTRIFDNIRLGINTKFLLEILKLLEGDIVTFNFTNTVAPIQINSTDLNEKFILMPLRIHD